MNPNTDPNVLAIWTIYQNPSDFPGKTVARCQHVIHGAAAAQGETIEGSLEALRERFRSMGLVNIGREPGDDPVIVEVWL